MVKLGVYARAERFIFSRKHRAAAHEILGHGVNYASPGAMVKLARCACVGMAGGDKYGQYPGVGSARDTGLLASGRDYPSTTILRDCTLVCLGMTISNSPLRHFAAMRSASAASGRLKRR